MRSASTLGSIRSTTVETPRRAAPIAARACCPSFSWVAGSAAVVRAMPAADWAWLAAASAASRARFTKSIGASLAVDPVVRQ